jgi:hypothetical protein
MARGGREFRPICTKIAYRPQARIFICLRSGDMDKVNNEGIVLVWFGVVNLAWLSLVWYVGFGSSG